MAYYVYLIEEEALPSEKSGPWTKIGYTQNPPEWRLEANLTRGNTRNLNIAAAFEFATQKEAREAERSAHAAFHDHLHQKEWFAVSWQRVAEWFDTNGHKRRLGPIDSGTECTDMKSHPDSEVKQLATRPGPKQYLAFDELARRVRDNPSSWSQEKAGGCNALDTRAPNAGEMEWAFLKWSQQWNDGKDPELEQEQDARLDELERHLGQYPDSPDIANSYFNAIGGELRKADRGTVEPPAPGVQGGVLAS